mgnify:CR=1 FL=1
MIDFYEVLDLDKNCKRNDIKKKYRKLIMIYHPDKGGDAKLFELITLSYETLIDESKRKEYDKAFELWKQSNNDHFSLKNNSINFLETQNELNEELEDDKLEEIKNNFNIENKETVLTKDEMNKRIKELELAREQDDLENIQTKICSSDNFNSIDFNAGFDACIDRKKSLINIPLQSNNSNYNNNKIDGNNNFDENDIYSSINNTGFKIKFIRKLSRYINDRFTNEGEFKDTRSSQNIPRRIIKLYDIISLEEGDNIDKSLSRGEIPFAGSNGCDSVLIAYDCLSYAKESFEVLVYRSMLHFGDTDTTGCIAAGWWGAYYGDNLINPPLEYLENYELYPQKKLSDNDKDKKKSKIFYDYMVDEQNTYLNSLSRELEFFDYLLDLSYKLYYKFKM